MSGDSTRLGQENEAQLERAIRAARARSNAGIAAHDLDVIAAEWTPEITVVSSTGAAATGVAANRTNLARQFERRPDTLYVRAPVLVRVFKAWAVASERGEWVGTWTEPDGPLRIGGTYEAQWRHVEGRWLIQGELYVPVFCDGGAYCQAHP